MTTFNTILGIFREKSRDISIFWGGSGAITTSASSTPKKAHQKAGKLPRGVAYNKGAFEEAREST